MLRRTRSPMIALSLRTGFEPRVLLIPQVPVQGPAHLLGKAGFGCWALDGSRTLVDFPTGPSGGAGSGVWGASISV